MTDEHWWQLTPQQRTEAVYKQLRKLDEEAARQTAAPGDVEEDR